MAFIKERVFLAILMASIALTVGIVGAEKPVFAASGKQGPFGEFRLAPDDAVENSQYGRSVAIGGDLVAVGMGGDGAVGAVYLYRRQGMEYIPEATLLAPDASDGAEFGRAVIIEGNTVIVGARFAQVGTLSKAGAAYVYRKCGNAWTLVNKVASPNPANGDNFGRALAIQDDTLVITARKEKVTEDDVGAAYVYRSQGGTWVFQEKLTASDPSAGAYFGQSVALHGDLLAVGARNANPNGAGAFYLFRRTDDGWREVAKVTPDDGQDGDQYGFSIAFEGNTLAVGARRADLPAANIGAVYVYSVRGNSVRLVTKLLPADAEKGDEFGQSVAISGDVLAAGAWKDDQGRGSIYLFRRTRNGWVETVKVTASDGAAGDEFGYSLAASGNRMVTGAHTADFISTDGGAAYVLPLKPWCPKD